MSAALLSPESLINQIKTTSPLILDVRASLTDPEAGAKAYRTGHIPGAFFIDFDKAFSATPDGTNGRHPWPSEKQIQTLLATLGVTKDTSIVLYDAGDYNFAARAWVVLTWFGLTNVAVLDGGFKVWRDIHAPISTQAPAPREAAGLIEPAVNPCIDILELADVIANLNSRTFQLLDARAGVRYYGEAEPIDPIAGHIPGAWQRASMDNIDEQGRVKAPAQLKKELLDLVQETPLETIVHTCGSGVSACVNLLAFNVAGLPTPRLYAGSWSEWCAEPTNRLQPERRIGRGDENPKR